MNWWVPLFIFTTIFTLGTGPLQTILAYRLAHPDIKQHKRWFMLHAVLAPFYSEFKNVIVRIAHLKEYAGDRQWKVTPRPPGDGNEKTTHVPQDSEAEGPAPDAVASPGIAGATARISESEVDATPETPAVLSNVEESDEVAAGGDDGWPSASSDPPDQEELASAPSDDLEPEVGGSFSSPAPGYSSESDMVDKPNVDWQPLADAYPYVYLGSAVTKDQRRDVEHPMGLMIAIGIGTDGYQHLLGVAEGEHTDPADWRGFVNQLKARGLDGVRLVNGTVPVRALEVVGQCFPDAQTQLCVAHWYRTVLADVPPDKRMDVTRMLKGIHAAVDRQAALRRARDVSKKLTELQLRKAATVVRETAKHTATYYAFPTSHWHLIRTNNPHDRVRREIRSRTVAARELPEATPLTWLVAGWLQHMASTKWKARRYLVMEGVESVRRASSGLSKTA